jgi:hypothetical protein
MFLVSQAFVDDSECRNCTAAIPDAASDAEMMRSLYEKSRNGSLERLDAAECVSAYGTLIQSTRRNLLVVTANENINSGSTDTIYPPDSPYINNTNWYMIQRSVATEGLRAYARLADSPVDWICSGLPYHTNSICINELEAIKSGSQAWTLSRGCSGGPEGYCDRYRWPVDYCLSEAAEPRCQLHFNRVIAIIVTVLNFCKSLIAHVFFAQGSFFIPKLSSSCSFLTDLKLILR